MKRLIISCVILFALLNLMPMGSPTQAQSSAETPYVYYFSTVLNNFVIERADGSDARQFGSDILVNEGDGVIETGWSSSGNWLAWTVYTGDPYDRQYLPAAQSLDGSTLVGLSEFATAKIAWSPNSDIMVAIGFVEKTEANPDPTLETIILRTNIINAATNTVLFSQELSDYVIGATDTDDPRARYTNLPNLYWTADGEYPIVRYANLTFGVNGTIAAGGIEYVYEALDLTGTVRQFKQLEEESIRETTKDGIEHGLIARSPVTDPSMVIIHDLIADEDVEIDTGGASIMEIAFSPSGEAALFIGKAADCEADCPDAVWLWHRGETELSLVVDGLERQAFHNEPFWSPDGSYAVMVQPEFIPVALDMSTGAVLSINDVPNTVYWQWNGASTVLLGTTGDEGMIYQVDLSTNTVQNTMIRREASDLYEIGKISPDGSAFAYVEDNPVILDLETGTDLPIRPDGRSYFSITGGEVYWSADSEWLLSAEEGLIAGGGAPRWTSIVKRDGSMRRELGRFSIMGWLPESVDVAQLPTAEASPLFPRPAQIISAPDWTFILSWSPDGSQIVRGAKNLGGVLGPSTVFDVETGEVVAELEGMDFETQRVEWTQNEDGSYTASVIQQSVPSGEFGGYEFGSSPDGSLTAEYGGSGGDNVTIYDVESGDVLYTEYRLSIMAVSFMPDNSLVVISSPYAPTVLIEGNTWEPVLTFNTHATAVAFSPDGETLALANSWDIELYDVAELMSLAD